MRNSFLKTLNSLAESDPDIVLLTADLGFGVFEDFESRFPRQYFNVGVAEQNMTGVATGLALEGKKVFTYSIANFPTLRCLEQIRNDAAYHNANITIVASGGGFSYGALGMSHHATEDLAILRALPNVTVVAPGTKWETEQATKSLVTTPGVGYLRLDKTIADDNEGNLGGEFKLGKARRIRNGDALTLISAGGILSEAMQAAENLSKKGIECRVVSCHTIKPLDEEEIKNAVLDTEGIITLEEHNILGGLGGAIAEYCMENSLIPKYFKRIGLRDEYSSVVGSQEYLRAKYKMDAQSIVELILNILR